MNDFVSPSGQISWGILSEPAGAINYMDYPLRNAFREIVPEVERHRQFVHFHFMGFTSPNFIAGCSVTLNGDSKTAFFYLFNRASSQLEKFGFRLTDPNDGMVTLNPDDGVTQLQKNGNVVTLSSDAASLSKTLHVVSAQGTEVNFHFSEKDNQFETLRLCTPTAANGWTYCQKVAGISAEGNLKYSGKTHKLNEMPATAHHDFTAGFLRRDTFWNWACVTDIQPNGDLIGINISNGVNETGASENRVWINGKAETLGLFMFSYDPDNLEGDWIITCNQGSKLIFKSEGKYSAYNNNSETGVDFTQLFGTFSGTLVTHEGSEITLGSLAGFCERQFSIWY
jgi:hypothetical protein